MSSPGKQISCSFDFIFVHMNGTWCLKRVSKMGKDGKGKGWRCPRIDSQTGRQIS